MKWKTALKTEPIPGWVIRELAESIGSQTELADRLGITARTVRHWIAGDRACRGASATAVRMLAESIKD